MRLQKAPNVKKYLHNDEKTCEGREKVEMKNKKKLGYIWFSMWIFSYKSLVLKTYFFEEWIFFLHGMKQVFFDDSIIKLIEDEATTLLLPHLQV